MNKSRNLIITLVIILLVLVVALVGVMIYFMSKEEPENNGVVLGNNINNAGNNVGNNIGNNIGNNVVNNEINNQIGNVVDEEGDLAENEVTNTVIESTPIIDNDGNNIEEDTTGDIEKLIFNTKFTAYIGDITGAKLTELLKETAKSNAENTEHKVSLTSNNLSNLNGIVATDIYTITLSYDDNGYVNKVNIDKK